MVETETCTIEGSGGDTGALELPVGPVDVFAEQGENPTDVVADVAVQAFTQQAHVIVHHSEGGASTDIAEINEQMEELFKDRFDVPLSNALGYSYQVEIAGCGDTALSIVSSRE